MLHGFTSQQMHAYALSAIALASKEAPTEFSDHDKGIIADIEAMAKSHHTGWWSRALASAALRIIRREGPAPVLAAEAASVDTVQDDEIIKRFEAVIAQDLDAYTRAGETVYQVTRTEILAYTRAHVSALANSKTEAAVVSVGISDTWIENQRNQSNLTKFNEREVFQHFARAVERETLRRTATTPAAPIDVAASAESIDNNEFNALIEKMCDGFHNSIPPYLAARKQVIEHINDHVAAQVGAKQAEIDRLMLEFCPDEMAEDQTIEWANNQRCAIPAAAPATPSDTLIRDLVKLWDSPSVSEDDHNEEMCRIEDAMRKAAARPSSIQPVAHLSLHATAGARHIALGIKAAANELPDGEYDLFTSLPSQPVAEGYEELALPEPLEIDWPVLHSTALGCGVEDRGLHGRYECAEYGFQEGVDQAASRVPDDIYDSATVREIQCEAFEAGRAQLAERVAVLEAALGFYADPKSNCPGALAREVLAATPQPHADEAAKGGV
jgi:hypothetical protein